MATQPGILRKGNKFRTNMTTLEFLEFSKTQEHVKHDSDRNKTGFITISEHLKRINGSATAVRSLRAGFQNLLERSDNHFTGRLMKVVTGIYNKDREGEHHKRSIFFSRHRSFLHNINNINIRKTGFDMIAHLLDVIHSEDRIAATLIAKEVEIKSCIIPRSATHYRILHHLSVISDFAFSEDKLCYEPLGVSNEMSVIVYSEYMPVGTMLDTEVVASFPSGTVLSDADTVIACAGIEFCYETGAEHKKFFLCGGGVGVVDVF